MILSKMFSVLLALHLVFLPQASKQELNDQMFEAVRQGDVAAVGALLDKGADVNAKFRYGSTALFKAAERGNVEVVKLLLARGADANVKDTFYGATAMTWAMDNKHFDVVKVLIAKMPDEVEGVLLTGAREGDLGLVQAALNAGGVKPDALTLALAVAADDAKKADIVETLKKAGAAPPPVLELATLQLYAGKYRGEPGPEISFQVKDGKLVAVAGGEFVLMAMDKSNFRPVAFGGINFEFVVDGDKVTGVNFKQGPSTTLLKRVP